VDLAFDLDRINRAADVVRGVNLQHLRRAELEIDLCDRDLSCERVRRVRRALAILVGRRRRRIEEAFAGDFLLDTDSMRDAVRCGKRSSVLRARRA
jgi:hypothetical protein